MTDESLRRAILSILRRLDPQPLREQTLAAEAEIAVGRGLTAAEFQEAVSGLRHAGLVRRSKDPLLGSAQWGLTESARKILEGM